MKYAMMFPSSSSVCHTETAQVRRRPSSHHSWTSVSGACAVVFFWPLSPIYQIRILQILGAKLHTEISFFQPIGSPIFHSHQLVGHFRCTCVAFMRCALHCLRSRRWPVLLGLAPKISKIKQNYVFFFHKKYHRNRWCGIVGAIIWPSVPYFLIMDSGSRKDNNLRCNKKRQPSGHHSSDQSKMWSDAWRNRDISWPLVEFPLHGQQNFPPPGACKHGTGSQPIRPPHRFLQFADPGNQLRGTVRLLVSSSQLRKNRISWSHPFVVSTVYTYQLYTYNSVCM